MAEEVVRALRRRRTDVLSRRTRKSIYFHAICIYIPRPFNYRHLSLVAINWKFINTSVIINRYAYLLYWTWNLKRISIYTHVDIKRAVECAYKRNVITIYNERFLWTSLYKQGNWIRALQRELLNEWLLLCVYFFKTSFHVFPLVIISSFERGFLWRCESLSRVPFDRVSIMMPASSVCLPVTWDS